MTETIALKAKRSGLEGKDGYTLIEILIVLAIIALLVALVGPRMFDLFDKSKATATAVEIKTLKTQLDIMMSDIGRYPDEQEGLALLMKPQGQAPAGWAGPYLSSDNLPVDKWNKPYLYFPDPNGGPPKVGSYGKDGKVNGEGSSADIIQ